MYYSFLLQLENKQQIMQKNPRGNLTQAHVFVK